MRFQTVVGDSVCQTEHPLDAMFGETHKIMTVPICLPVSMDPSCNPRMKIGDIHWIIRFSVRSTHLTPKGKQPNRSGGYRTITKTYNPMDPIAHNSSPQALGSVAASAASIGPAQFSDFVISAVTCELDEIEVNRVPVKEGRLPNGHLFTG
jgi:hypothetical protein